MQELLEGLWEGDINCKKMKDTLVDQEVTVSIKGYF